MKRLQQISTISLKQWIASVVIFKVLMFVYFAFQYYYYWESERIVNGIAIETGDTFGYYRPATDLANGLKYENLCRMPGVVPLYTPVAALVGEQNAKVWMVFCQLILSIISIFILAQWAQDIFKGKFIFELILILYTLSSFTSVFDHLMMADSLSISFFIFFLYFLNKGIGLEKWKFFLFAGAFLAWSVFLRQIMLVVYPIAGLLMLHHFKAELKKMLLFGGLIVAPLVIAIGLWSQHTLGVSGRRIFLAIPVEECYSTYTKEYQAAAGLLIDMGYGEPFWTEGSLPQWFFRSDSTAKIPQIPNRHFDDLFSKKDLIELRNEYRAFARLSSKQRSEAGDHLRNEIEKTRTEYKHNHKLDYYVLNKLRHARIFLMPLKLENIPGPSFQDMSMFQKSVKLFYLLFFSIIAPLGLLVLTYLLFKLTWSQRIWIMFPLSIFITLTFVLGFVEQRYFAPIYPFCIVGLSVVVSNLLKRTEVSR